MGREFLGTGWKFPVQLDANGFFTMSQAEDDIRESIIIILKTAKGERVMRPDVGCGINEYLFASFNTATKALVEASVKDALIKWEPRIEIQRVNVSDESDSEHNENVPNDGVLFIEIDYTVRATNNRFNMVFPFYLNER